MYPFKSTVCMVGTMVAAFLGFFAPCAYPASYSFTGTATVDATTLGDAHLNGPDLNLTFLSMQSPGAGFFDCSGGGSECLPQFTISGESGASPAVAFGVVNGITAAHMTGGLTLASPSFGVDGAQPGAFTLQEPLTVSGSLVGIDPNANELFTVNVNANGTTNLTGIASIVNGTTIVDFTKVAFAFDGSVTAVPEPSSAIPLAAGLLAGGAGFLRRRRRTQFLSSLAANRRSL